MTTRPNKPQTPWTPPPIQSPQPTKPLPSQVQVEPNPPLQGYPSGPNPGPNNIYSNQSVYTPPPNYPQQQPLQQPMYYAPSQPATSNYQNPFPNQQVPPQAQPPYGQPPYGQPQQGQPTYFPNFPSSAAGQLGLQFGSEAFQQVSKNMNQNIDKYVKVNKLRYYFKVSHSYVFNKIKLLFFPFRHASWSRLSTRSESNNEEYRPPREDLNAPDLYIPLMSLVTYILLVGIGMGIKDKSKFTPDVLGVTASTASFILVLEILLIKLGGYLLNVHSDMLFMDLAAYCGYKYVPINTMLLLKFVFTSRWVWIGLFTYSMLAFGFFTLRSLRYIILPDSHAGNEVLAKTARKRRIVFLFLIAGVEILTSLLLL